jgi:predicted nucleic acid-binding protein
MGVLVDTDHLIDLQKGTDRAELLQVLIADEPAMVSVITVSELLHGAHRAAPGRYGVRLAFVDRILAALDVLPIDESVARAHAAVGAEMAAAGVTIGTHDLWIGASALANGLGIATHNSRDFGRIPGLRVVSP